MEAALDIHGMIQTVINSMECYANMIVAMSRVRQHQHYASIMRYVACYVVNLSYISRISEPWSRLLGGIWRDMHHRWTL